MRRHDSPPFGLLKLLDRKLRTTRPWKIVAVAWLWGFLWENMAHLLFLNAPEPYAKAYTRNYFRATWVLNCLDAGFLSCMHIRPKILRDILSPLMSAVYLFYPEHADYKVKKFHSHSTVQAMRCSWEKSTNPLLYALVTPLRGLLSIHEDILIPIDAAASIFPQKPRHVKARLYFYGSRQQLARATRLIFSVPGGGFVTMHPANHDDYLFHWARMIRVPIVAIDYGKAPEFPYPYGLEECFDAYKSVVESNGEVIGLDGWYEKDSKGRPVNAKKPIKIIMVGDSAGGNIATGCIIKCLETGNVDPPSAFISIYPCLSFDLACWMPKSQIEMLRNESMKSLHSLIDTKLRLRQNAPLETDAAPRSIDVLNDKVDRSESWYHKLKPKIFQQDKETYIPSALSMTSRMSYFNDRIIQPELIRGMALLYLSGSPAIPDVSTDYYLSPLLVPDEILSRFPKTYFIVGEKDPLVDDTVVFAGRLKDAKIKAHLEWIRFKKRRSASHDSSFDGKLGLRMDSRRNAAEDQEDEVSEDDLNRHLFAQQPDSMVRVKVLEGISHGFFQMMALMPEARQAVRLTSEWFIELFQDVSIDRNAKPVSVERQKSAHLTDMMVQEMEDLEWHGKGRETYQGASAYYLTSASRTNLASRNSHEWKPASIDDDSSRVKPVVVSTQMKEVSQGSMIDKRRGELATVFN